MIVVLVSHRPHEGQSIGNPRDFRKLIADRHARHGRADRSPLAPNLFGSIRLGIPRLVLRRCALQVQQQNPFGFSKGRLRTTLRLRCGKRFEPQQFRQRQRTSTECTDSQNLATVPFTAERIGGTENSQHFEASAERRVEPNGRGMLYGTRGTLTQTPPSLSRWFWGFCTTQNS